MLKIVMVIYGLTDLGALKSDCRAIFVRVNSVVEGFGYVLIEVGKRWKGQRYLFKVYIGVKIVYFEALKY